VSYDFRIWKAVRVNEFSRLVSQKCRTDEYFNVKIAKINLQAPVVRKVDNTIHRINHYPEDDVTFEQPGTEL